MTRIPFSIWFQWWLDNSLWCLWRHFDQKFSGSDAWQWKLLLQDEDGQLLPYYPRGRKFKQKTFTVEHVARLRTSISQHCLATSMLTACGGAGGKKAGQKSQDSSEWVWPMGGVEWPLTREGSTNGSQPGHWPLALSPPPRVDLSCWISAWQF